MTRAGLAHVAMVCLTVLAVWSAARWWWPSLGIVAVVGAALSVGLLLNVTGGIVHALRLRSAADWSRRRRSHANQAGTAAT